MLKRLVLISALLAPMGTQAQTVFDLFRLGTNLATLAGSGTAAADPTPPTALTWDIPAPTPRSEIRSQDAARLAITKLDERIKRAPDSAHLYVARGQQYGRVRNERACLNDLLVAKAKGATDSLLNLYLAHASLLREQAAEAQKYLEQQRTLTPNSPEADIFEARLWLARPGILSQNSKQALLLLEKAIALDSTNQKARLLRGYTYFATNKPAQAIGDYQQFLRKEPYNERANFYLGQAYLAAGDNPAACRHFTAGKLFAPTQANWYLRKYCR